jgi:hypothetical protein
MAEAPRAEYPRSGPRRSPEEAELRAEMFAPKPGRPLVLAGIVGLQCREITNLHQPLATAMEDALAKGPKIEPLQVRLLAGQSACEIQRSLCGGNLSPSASMARHERSGAPWRAFAPSPLSECGQGDRHGVGGTQHADSSKREPPVALVG